MRPSIVHGIVSTKSIRLWRRWVGTRTMLLFEASDTPRIGLMQTLVIDLYPGLNVAKGRRKRV